MKISTDWLQEWVQPDASTDELAHQFTMAGLEVDAVEKAAPDFNHVCVGQILSVHQHNSVKKLSVCQVDVGDKKPLIIVCGAVNVRSVLKVAVARVGASLPGGKEIKLTGIRGVDSEGMLCSEQDLGMGEASDGILELLSTAPVAKDLRDYLNLDEQIIEIDLTPNRGDCLGMAGIAREVGVYNKVPVRGPKTKIIKPVIADTLNIDLQATEACPRYLGRIIREVNAKAVTPLWMQERLRRCGFRSLGPLVDVTNYVLLELGQPMHAFDLAVIHGKISVRFASKNEKLKLLDETEVTLNPDVLLIADDKGPLAMAGIMGGDKSGISESTSDIFLECAFFSPKFIAGKARQYGLQTESSYRFERGVDPEIQHQAMERATELLVSITGGKVAPIAEAVVKEHLPKKLGITLRQARIEKILGVSLTAKQIQDSLKRLGMTLAPIKNRKGVWRVQAPLYRFDISIEADLIEEVGRIYGYDNIPARKPIVGLAINPQPETTIKTNRFKSRLVDRGYQEVITYSFVSPEIQATVNPEVAPVTLANPMSAELSVMRTSLWAGLLQTIKYNLNRQQSTIKIFETGLSFISQGTDISQKNMISGAICGNRCDEQWMAVPEAVDFFDIKGDVESLIALTGDKQQFEFVNAKHPALHPGQCAQIIRAGQALGWLGKLHPEVAAKQHLSADIYLFELALEDTAVALPPAFSALSKYPAIRRDIAIVVDEKVTSGQIFKVIRSTIPEQLQDIKLFDVYRGKGIDSGRKSLALGLILQESSRTLVDQEADRAIEWVIVRLKKELDASLRD